MRWESRDFSPRSLGSSVRKDRLTETPPHWFFILVKSVRGGDENSRWDPRLIVVGDTHLVQVCLDNLVLECHTGGLFIVAEGGTAYAVYWYPIPDPSEARAQPTQFGGPWG